MGSILGPPIVGNSHTGIDVDIDVDIDSDLYGCVYKFRLLWDTGPYKGLHSAFLGYLEANWT